MKATPWLRTWCGGLLAGLVLLAATEARAADAAREVKVKDVVLQVPAGWKEMPVANKLRLAQFAVPPVEGDEGDSELVISSFDGGGGGVDANIRRWIQQFQPAERKVKIVQGTSKQGKYYLVDVAGTYNKPDGPPFLQKTKPVPGSRMLGLILVVEDKGVYFFKLPGPQKTIAAAVEPFRTSFGGDAKSEKDYELAE
jgi:gluconolactonase